MEGWLNQVKRWFAKPRPSRNGGIGSNPVPSAIGMHYEDFMQSGHDPEPYGPHRRAIPYKRICRQHPGKYCLHGTCPIDYREHPLVPWDLTGPDRRWLRSLRISCD